MVSALHWTEIVRNLSLGVAGPFGVWLTWKGLKKWKEERLQTDKIELYNKFIEVAYEHKAQMAKLCELQADLGTRKFNNSQLDLDSVRTVHFKLDAMRVSLGYYFREPNKKLLSDLLLVSIRTLGRAHKVFDTVIEADSPNAPPFNLTDSYADYGEVLEFLQKQLIEEFGAKPCTD